MALNAPDLNDPLIVRNQVYNIEVWLLVPTGPPIPILTFPRYLGPDPNRIKEFADVAAKTTQVRVSVHAARQMRQAVARVARLRHQARIIPDFPLVAGQPKRYRRLQCGRSVSPVESSDDSRSCRA